MSNLHLPVHAEDDLLPEQQKVQRGQYVDKRSITEYRHAPPHKRGFLNFVENFNPLWFALCISSGGLGEVLNGPFPYPARWLVTCASIFYVFELVLFVFFMIILLLRMFLYPHVSIRRARKSPDELGAYVIPAISLLTLSGLTATQVSNTRWGGHAFTLVAYVMWWIGVAWVFVYSLVFLTILFRTGLQNDRNMVTPIFMPLVALATCATEAGLISTYAYDASPRLVVPMIVTGYFTLGAAIFASIMLYTIFMHRLMAVGFPPPNKSPSLAILVGPVGQEATALLVLGEAAVKSFPLYKGTGEIWNDQFAMILRGSGFLIALLMMGFGYIWLLLSLYYMFDTIIKRKSEYSLIWWALIFPLIVMDTAWLELASSMDSPTFRVLTVLLFMFLLIGYFVNLALTLRGVFNGSLLFGPSWAEIEQSEQKKADEEMRVHNNGTT